MNRFIKGMVAIATAMSLAGCATGNNDSAVSGEFTGTAKGMGDITVTVTLEDSILSSQVSQLMDRMKHRISVVRHWRF